MQIDESVKQANLPDGHKKKKKRKIDPMVTSPPTPTMMLHFDTIPSATTLHPHSGFCLFVPSVSDILCLWAGMRSIENRNIKHLTTRTIKRMAVTVKETRREIWNITLIFSCQGKYKKNKRKNLHSVKTTKALKVKRNCFD